MLHEAINERSRKELIRLIKNLPENHIPVVKTFLEFIRHENGNPILKEFLANFPEEEEELTEEFKHELKKLSKEAKKELKEGKTISLDELKKQYDL